MPILNNLQQVHNVFGLYFFKFTKFWFTPRDSYAVIGWCNDLRSSPSASLTTKIACTIPNELYKVGNFLYEQVPTAIFNPTKTMIDHVSNVNTLRFVDMVTTSSKCAIDLLIANYEFAAIDCVLASYSIVSGFNGIYNEYRLGAYVNKMVSDVKYCKKSGCTEMQLIDILNRGQNIQFDTKLHSAFETGIRDFVETGAKWLKTNTISYSDTITQSIKFAITQDLVVQFTEISNKKMISAWNEAFVMHNQTYAHKPDNENFEIIDSFEDVNIDLYGESSLISTNESIN